MNQEATQIHPRFALTTTVVLREASGTAILAKLKNISLSGCYVETPRQVTEGARIRVALQVVDIHADVWGIVQRRDATGLGIRFSHGATVEDWKRLESFIKELHQAVPSTSVAATGQA